MATGLRVAQSGGVWVVERADVAHQDEYLVMLAAARPGVGVSRGQATEFRSRAEAERARALYLESEARYEADPEARNPNVVVRRELARRQAMALVRQ